MQTRFRQLAIAIGLLGAVGCGKISVNVQLINNCNSNVTLSALDSDGNPTGEPVLLVPNTSTTVTQDDIPSFLGSGDPAYAQIDPATKEIIQQCISKGAKNGCYVVVVIDQNCNIQCNPSSCSSREPGLENAAAIVRDSIEDVGLINSIFGALQEPSQPCDCKK